MADIILKGNITILHASLWQNWELPKTIEPQYGETIVLPHSKNFQIALKVLFSSFIQSTEWGMKYMMFNESKSPYFCKNCISMLLQIHFVFKIYT